MLVVELSSNFHRVPIMIKKKLPGANSGALQSNSHNRKAEIDEGHLYSGVERYPAKAFL